MPLHVSAHAHRPTRSWRLQQIVRRVPVADHVTRYALQFTRLTRHEKGERARLHPRLRELGRRPAREPVPGAGGQGPRRAARPVPTSRAEDIRAVALPVLRHRIMTNFNAEAEGIKPDDIVRRLIEFIPIDEAENDRWKNSPKYFDPQTLAKLKGLELRARTIVEGYVSGVHRSPYHGFSIEFAEHREYVPGDDLRYVDWKVFGKTDKFYLKQYEEETNLVCYLLLDTSESMRYQSAAGRAVEARVRPVRRRVAGLPGPAAARQRRPGDVRQRDPRAGAAQQQSVAPEATAARDGAKRVPERKTAHRPDLPRPGRAAQEARRGGRAQRPVRRRAVDARRAEALSPSPARRDRVPRARSGRARFPFQQTTLFKGLEQLPDVLTDPRRCARRTWRSSTSSCSRAARLPRTARSITCSCGPTSRWTWRCQRIWRRG